MMSSLTRQIGWIPYLNLHPLLVEIKKSGGTEISLRSGHPSAVNHWLRSGEVSLAPSSSINLLYSPSTELAFPLGVASTGDVMSVYLGFNDSSANLFETFSMAHESLCNKAHLTRLFNANLESAGSLDEQRSWLRESSQRQSLSESLKLYESMCARVLFSDASEASNGLVRLFLRLWSIHSRDVISASSSLSNERVEVVIGDAALSRRAEFANILDLGRIWFELTQLPFVFAVWQANRELCKNDDQLNDFILQCGQRAATLMKQTPEDYLNFDNRGASLPVDQAVVREYWQRIDYVLGPSHIRGMKLYLSLYLDLLGGQDSALKSRVEEKF